MFRHKPLYYNLGEMKGGDGSSLLFETRMKTAEYTIAISKTIESGPIFKRLSDKLKSPRLLLYFQYVVKEDIYPFVRQGCIINWYKRNGKALPPGKDTVVIPNVGILRELEKCWDLKDVPVKFLSPVSFRVLFDSTCKLVLRKLIRDEINKFRDGINGAAGKFRKYSRLDIKEKEILACHYAEGIDYLKRNDLNWYPLSCIRPEKILIYVDSPSSKTGKSLERKIIEDIEKQGFKWVTLKKGAVEGRAPFFWKPPKFLNKFNPDRKDKKSVLEQWLVKTGNNLLKEAHFWRSFYDEFDVRINYIPEEGTAKNIIQAIAFDMCDKKQGVLVGKQRSEMFLENEYIIGFHPKHIFFTWNDRPRDYLKPNYERIEKIVVSGYPNNVFKKWENHRDRLKTGVKFVIALFDNVYSRDIHFSAEGMTGFYRAFLEWLIEDEEIGLIIKSKKPYIINSLSLIQPILDEALKTGRCIRLEDVWGRLPSEASLSVDMAVGIGISSAVIEAVITGTKGIHCDITRFRKHEFYKWGYGRIIFDDLNRMMAALKRYKKNRQSETGLGDWSLYIDRLDPFRDGKGGERMGIYMKSLLDGFRKFKDRNLAMEYADQSYKEQWGEDKIIEMGKVNETA